MSRGLIAVLAIFFVGGPMMIAGATWGYIDEHSGTAADAKVIDCYSTGRGGKYSSVYCTGRWTVGGRTTTGDIANGRLSDEGKTIPVRVHGGRASKPQLWVSIALGVFGVVILGFGIWLTVVLRRRGLEGRVDGYVDAEGA